MTGTKLRYAGRKVTISTDFDGGHLTSVEERKTNVFEILPYRESEYRDGFVKLDPFHPEEREFDNANVSFLFSVEGCKDEKLTFRFHLKETEKATDVSVVYANPDFPVFSYDGKAWRRMERKSLLSARKRKGWKVVTAEQIFTRSKAYVAYQYPYTNEHLARYIMGIQDSPYCTIEVAGVSTEGRIIPQVSITDPSVPLKGKKVAWMTGLQHSAELGAGWGQEEMMDYLLSGDAGAREARRRCEFKFVPIVNVDAVAEGKGRIHSSGRNLNREWERSDPVPEIGSIRRTLSRWKANGRPIDIFIDFHGFSPVNGRWYFVILPDEAYKGPRAAEYQRLLDTIGRHFPFAQSGPNPSVGFAAGAGCREYGALSLSVDGWVYPAMEGQIPELSSCHKDGAKVYPLRGIKAAGEGFVKALSEFAM